MLTAWDKVRQAAVALPDYARDDPLDSVRTRARMGELVCPTCQQLLWLRAGEIRLPHFGHRTLNDCPQSRASEAVLAARDQLYRFFRARIASGKLPGEVELEPRISELPPRTSLDLLVKRKQRNWVAVWVIESQIKPELRTGMQSAVGSKRWIFRPVFLETRLKPAPDHPHQFLLNTTERDFRFDSAYDLHPTGIGRTVGSLHFINAAAGRWTTLRALALVHEPQMFESRLVRVSALTELLWSEGQSEWVHPGEAEALAGFRQQIAAAKRERVGQSIVTSPDPRSVPVEQVVSARVSEAVAPPSERREELPGWFAQGLACIACGRRTVDWQNASPAEDACVCRECFARGVRLR